MSQHLRTSNLAVGLLLLAAAGCVNAASCGGDYCIDWYSFDSGGVMLSQSADQQWTLSGSIGQWDASEARELSGGSWRLTGGFWGSSVHFTADITLSDLLQTYTGDPLGVTVTTAPEGLSYEVTYDGSTDEPTDADSYAVIVTITEPNYEGSASDTFTIDPAPATLTLDDLEQTWNGDPKPVTVTPDPAGVSYGVTYDGSTEPPSDVGEYAVVATIADDNYTGDDATGTLVISEADSETSIDSISPSGSQTVGESYTVAVTVTGESPTGTVDVNDGTGGSCQITLSGGSGSCSLTSTTVGSKTITATYSGDDSHGGSSDTASYDINEASSTTMITQIDPSDEQTVHESYTVTVGVDGFGPTGTVAVDDGDGNDCQITLSGGSGSCQMTSTTVGTRTITASYDGDDNNDGSQATDTYTIVADEPHQLVFSVQPDDAISLLTMDTVVVHVHDEHGNLVDWDNVTEIGLSLTGGDSEAELTGGETITVGAGVASFDALSIDLVGSDYQLLAEASGLDEALSVEFEIFHGEPFELMFIDQPTTTQVNELINPAVTVGVLDEAGNLADTENETEVELTLIGGDDGANLSGTTTATVDEGIATFGDLSVDLADTDYQLNAAVADEKLAGDTSDAFDITTIPAEVTLSDLIQTYTGDALGVSVSTDPEGLSYEVTYDGSTDKPTDSGSYAVVVTITEPNYEGSASDTFTIDPAPATLTLDDLEQTWDGDPKPVTVTPDPSSVSYSVSYDGSTEPPSEIGDYAVVATITDDNYTGDDATGTLVISEADSETSIDSISPSDSQTVGETYTVTVTVTGESLTGTVDVDDGTGFSCQITLPEDNCQMISDTVGSKTITATYSGDDNHAGSSDTASYEITQAESQIEINAIDPTDEQTVNEPYTVTVSVDGFEVTGTVDVDDGTGGSCQITLPDDSCQMTSTTVGTKTITASYGGDANNEGSSAEATYEIVSDGPVALSLSVAPSQGVAGEVITPGLSVQVVDSQGDLVDDDNSTVVTVSFETNPTGATLSGTTELTVTGGEAHFGDLSIDLIGEGYRLRVSDTEDELEDVVTEPFDILGPDIFHDRFEEDAE